MRPATPPTADEPVSEPAAASNTATDCPYCSLQCAMQIVQQPGEWEMYVGGAAIAHLRKGDLLCTVDDPDAAMLMTGRFIQYYRENARWLERTYGFMERIGVDTVRAVLVDDRDRDGERLDAELERSLSAYPHGWRAASPSRPTSSRLRSEPSADRAWQFAGEFDGGYRPIGEQRTRRGPAHRRARRHGRDDRLVPSAACAGAPGTRIAAARTSAASRRR